MVHRKDGSRTDEHATPMSHGNIGSKPQSLFHRGFCSHNCHPPHSGHASCSAWVVFGAGNRQADPALALERASADEAEPLECRFASVWRSSSHTAHHRPQAHPKLSPNSRTLRFRKSVMPSLSAVSSSRASRSAWGVCLHALRCRVGWSCGHAKGFASSSFAF